MASMTDTESARPRRDGPTTRGLTAAAACAKRPLRDAAGKRGIAEARLLTHWPEIAGQALADASRPIRIKARAGKALGGVLVLAVDGARASEIEHSIPRVIERVNAHYGYRAIAEVKLTQAAGPVAAAPTRPRRHASPETLRAEQREALETMTETVEDDALRAALRRLGANVMTRTKPTSDAPESALGR